MTYKKYLKKYHMGAVGELEEKTGLFIFFLDGPGDPTTLGH